MEMNNLLFAGGAIGIITATWGYIKQFIWKFLNLFIEQVEIHNEVLAQGIISHLIHKYKYSKFYERVFVTEYAPLKVIRNHRHLPGEVYGRKMMIFWDGWKPLVYGPKAEAPKTNNNNNSPSSSSSEESKKTECTITFLRGTFDIEKLVKDASAQKNNLLEEQEDIDKNIPRYYIKRVASDNYESWSGRSDISACWREKRYKLLSHTLDDIGYKVYSGSPINRLFFPKDITNLIEEIKLWKQSKNWYRTKHIPWKKGWMLYGKPGCGKTALVRAFGEELNIPVYIFDLAQMTNGKFIKEWETLKGNTPCIALFEDFDNVFHGRENVAKRANLFSIFGPQKKKNANGEAVEKKDDDGDGGFDPVNFDTFLNCLDGVETVEGIFTIITTNHIDKIDEALGKPVKREDGSLEFISSRPGRIDKAIELKPLTKDLQRRMAERILEEFPEQLKILLQEVENSTEEVTPAVWQEKCGQLALKEYWRTKI